MLTLHYERKTPYALEAVVIVAGKSLSVYLGGGNSPHIGTVVLAEPRPSLTGSGETSCTSSVLNLTGHKDEDAARPLAHELCRRFAVPVSLTAGIHVDYLSEADRPLLMGQIQSLCGEILADLTRRGSEIFNSDAYI